MTVSILIHLDECHGIARDCEPIRIGVPLPRGCLRDPARTAITDAGGRLVPHGARPLALWSDRSVKWLLIDALVPAAASCRNSLQMTALLQHEPAASDSEPRLWIKSTGSQVEVDTGRLRASFRKGNGSLLSGVSIDGVEMLRGDGARLRIVDRAGTPSEAVIDEVQIEEDGRLRAGVLIEGHFAAPGRVGELRFRARAALVAGSATVTLEVVLHNPRAARHTGGLWDLGDTGSCHFKDLTLALSPAVRVERLRWHAESPQDEQVQQDAASSRWTIYQDSSGGDQWQSPNHLDGSGRLSVSFRGYRVSDESGVLSAGDRATPVVTAVVPEGWIGVALLDFWQNFPKALRWREESLEIALFPAEASGPFELQGGEQKRHTALLEFGNRGREPTLAQMLRPLQVSLEPAWAVQSGAIDWLSVPAGEDAGYGDYIRQIIEGQHAFAAKRETIDEYGWRNFGELYADHEAARHTGPEPFVSHYNNQYDFVYGAFAQFMRSGDFRWRRLMEDAARHHIDIDIYHTREDKPAFNGGLFWHTDHYKPAATCTHRTYSRRNAGSGRYGGGPSNEHNYTSGLLHYYYLTGDREAAASVRELAEWVFGMDDGARTLYALIDSGPSGGASRTLESSYHRPGRGAGNSINALLDAYSLTRARRYLTKAEELLQRCIHPEDDIGTLRLDDPEHRWSYLVFLQVLGKYLTRKLESDEADYFFHYARASLLHYADWIASNEVAYKDVLHKVEIPTETWPAHDIRKCHVLHLAASYATDERRERFRQRARYFFERCLTDVGSFPTAHFTRPLVILCVYGFIHDYFQRQAADRTDGSGLHNHDFGAPTAFVPQQARLKATLTAHSQAALIEASRALRDRLAALRRKLGGGA